MTPRITGRRLVSAAAITGAAMVALAMPATAATNPATAGDALVTIKNHDGLCLDMTGGSTAAGAEPQLAVCNGEPQQLWETVTLSGDGKSFLIKNYDSGLCLSIANNDPNTGAAVIQWSCNSSGADYYEDWYRESSTLGPGTLVYNDGDGYAMAPSGNTGVFMGHPDNTSYLWKFLSA